MSLRSDVPGERRETDFLLSARQHAPSQKTRTAHTAETAAAAASAPAASPSMATKTIAILLVLAVFFAMQCDAVRAHASVSPAFAKDRLGPKKVLGAIRVCLSADAVVFMLSNQ